MFGTTKLINKVDAKSVQNILDDLKYGNCDISEWEGDLKMERDI